MLKCTIAMVVVKCSSLMSTCFIPKRLDFEVLTSHVDYRCIKPCFPWSALWMYYLLTHWHPRFFSRLSVELLNAVYFSSCVWMQKYKSPVLTNTATVTPKLEVPSDNNLRTRGISKTIQPMEHQSIWRGALFTGTRSNADCLDQVTAARSQPQPGAALISLQFANDMRGRSHVRHKTPQLQMILMKIGPARQYLECDARDQKSHDGATRAVRLKFSFTDFHFVPATGYLFISTLLSVSYRSLTW